MKRRTAVVVALLAAFTVAFGTLTALSFDCGDTWASRAPDTIKSCSGGAVSKTSHWRIYWVDGYERSVDVTDTGGCSAGLFTTTKCFPEFQAPHWKRNDSGFGEWDQVTFTGTYNPSNGSCGFATEAHHHIHRHACQTAGGGSCTTPSSGGSCPPGTYLDDYGMCCGGGSCGGGLALSPAAPGDAPAGGGQAMSLAPGGCQCEDYQRLACDSAYGIWQESTCTCYSPVLVDTLGDGFRLTDGAGGVRFDLTADGAPEQISWTAAGSDDAWLALDRDGNGLIDSGAELFGNFTPQPAPPAGEARNGFLALAVYDRAGNGGDGDGAIDAGDAVFARLRLWRDANHDGASQPGELFTLPALGVVRLHLDYKESRRADGHGNRFLYRAEVEDVRGAKVSRWAWDVFLVRAR